MLPTVIAFGILGAIFVNRQRSFTTEQVGDFSEREVRSYFAGPHEKYPRGARDIMIDGVSVPNIHAMGNPEPRNPMNRLFTYPQSRASAIINKNNERWEEVGIINKDRQLDLIEEKIAMDDHILLTPHYKQLSGCTVSARPKINLKNYFIGERSFLPPLEQTQALGIQRTTTLQKVGQIHL